MGGKIYKNSKINKINLNDGKIDSIFTESGDEITADYFISTMPIKDLFLAFSNAPENVLSIAKALEYRDFITMGVLVKNIRLDQELKDNWIYIQEPYVRVARLQFFHNWSEFMVADRKNAFIGMEYMCFEGDELWNKTDAEFRDFGVAELVQLGFINQDDVVATHIARIKKAYPSYSGVYGEFEKVRAFLDSVANLFVCGRNGMHRYNNMDHSMLSAFEVVDCIAQNKTDKSAIWNVNVEESYHEEKK